MPRWLFPLESALRNFRLNLFQNGLTVATAAFAYFILFLSLQLYLNLRQTLERLAESDAVAVFVEEGAAPAVLEEVRRRMDSLAVFGEVSFVPPERARQIFLARYSDLAGALEDLGENPFPPSFVGRLKEGLPGPRGGGGPLPRSTASPAWPRSRPAGRPTAAATSTACSAWAAA